MNDKKTKEFILKELEKFNFKRCTKGFKYLNVAIFLCIKNSDAIDNLHKNVFPYIAKMYNEESSIRVKWCIEQTIKTMYNNTGASKLCEYFSIDENMKPSLKFIIYTIVRNYEWTYSNN